MANKTQLSGMRGVYLVAAELVGHGFVVSVTSRSAAGADLLVRSFPVGIETDRDWAYLKTKFRSETT